MGLLVEMPSISQWDAVIPGRGVGAGLALRSGRQALTGDGWLPRSPARGLAACPPCGTLRLSLPQREFRAQLGLRVLRPILPRPSLATSWAGSDVLPGPQPPGALDGGGEAGRAPRPSRDSSLLRVVWVDAGVAWQLRPAPKREQRRSRLQSLFGFCFFCFWLIPLAPRRLC